MTSIGSSAFEWCTGLTSVTIPNSVTSIGSSAFYNCSGLTSITIPNSVTTIDSYAFKGCSGLTSVTIGNGVTKIGYEAFYKCSSLTSITIPKSVESIEKSAFHGCANVKSLTIECKKIDNSNGLADIFQCPSIESIIIRNCEVIISGFYSCKSLQSVQCTNCIVSLNNSAFYGCDALKTVEIDGEVVLLGNSTFAACTQLESVSIPGSFSAIGDYAFSGCSSLTSIEIPNSVTSIGSSAFYGCSSLTSITIPDGVTSIEEQTFYGCSGLTSVTIPDGVTSIEKMTFYGCSSLTSVTIPNSVTSIGNAAFSGCSSLTSVTIPNSVTSIGGGAFYGCSSLTSIDIPKSVESIGKSAFYGCDNVKSLTIECKKIDNSNGLADIFRCPSVETVIIRNCEVNISGFSGCKSLQSVQCTNSIISLSANAFKECNALKTVEIDGEVVLLGNSTFAACTQLESVSIPGSFSAIGYAAFSGCSSLTSVTIPNSVTSIGSSAFYDCSSLTSITIPDGVTSIEEQTFYGCSSLTSITIPDGVTSIGKVAFSDCSSLTSVTIPNSVTSIDRYAFSDCNSLTSITIPDGVTSIEEKTFQNCSGLTSVTIPNSVTSIGSYAFNSCTGLTSIEIPDGVTVMDRAFVECDHLQEITIPSSVTSMDGAFAECTNLIKIVSKMQIPPTIGSSTFSDYTYREGTLIIPVDATFEYETSAGWKKFVYMVEEGKEEKTAYELTIENEGTLKSTVENLETSRIEYVVIKGRLNGSDIAYLRSSEGKFAHLKTLDLKDVTLIPDDEPYYTFSEFNIEAWSTHIYEVYLSDHTSNTYLGIVSFVGWGPTTKTRIDSDGLAYAFTKTNLKTVILPSTIKRIGEGAFKSCSNLESVELPEGIQAVDEAAFGGCSSLTTIPSLEHIEEIGIGAFSGCSNLTGDLDLSSAKYVGENAFSGCGNITSVKFTSNLGSVDAGAFAGCSALSDVSFDENSDVIFSRTSFSSTPWNEKLPTEDGIVYMGKVAMAVEAGTEPRELTFRDGTLSIAHDFIEVSTYEKIRTLNLPNSIKRIGNYAFCYWSGGVRNGSNIEYINFPDGLIEIGSGAFDLNKRIEKIELPNSVKKVGYRAFANMEKLTTVKNYNGHTSGEEVFRGCEQLKEVYLGDNVRTLGEGMFRYCQSMSSITVYSSEVVEASDDDFYQVSKSYCVVYVPKNLVNSYKVADGWKEFDNIMEIPEIVPVTKSLEVSFSESIGDEGDLSNKVIENTYYNMNAENGDGYDTAEQAIILNSTTTTEQMNAILNTEVSENSIHGLYSGIIFEVAKGEGIITVDAKTVGSHVLNVQIGNEEPTKITMTERGTVDIPYNVAEPTYVYIYASTEEGNAARVYRAASTVANSVLLYGYKVTMDVSAIPGDANGDGVVNVTDIVEIVNAILGHPSDKFNEEAADVNGDGVVNVTDIVSVVNIILSSNAHELTNRAAATNNLKLSGGSIKLRNAENYTAAQFDINLPDGSAINYLSLNSASDHQMTWKMVDANTCRVIVYSLSNAPFRTTKDELFNVTLSGNATISNELLVNVDGSVTGINETLFDKPVDVYDLRGNKVRSNTTDLNGLQKGVYIVNGKKVIVK